MYSRLCQLEKVKRGGFLCCAPGFLKSSELQHQRVVDEVAVVSPNSANVRVEPSLVSNQGLGTFVVCSHTFCFSLLTVLIIDNHRLTITADVLHTLDLSHRPYAGCVQLPK